MPRPLCCLRTGGGFTVGAVDKLQQVLHPPVVLYPSVPLDYRLVLLTFGLLLLALRQAQAQLLAHLCIVSTSRSSRGLRECNYWVGKGSQFVHEFKISFNQIFIYIFSQVISVCVLPRHAQRTRSSSSHSTFLLSGWWKWRWRSCARSSCLHPDSPPHRTAGRTPRWPRSGALRSQDHWGRHRFNNDSTPSSHAAFREHTKFGRRSYLQTLGGALM